MFENISINKGSFMFGYMWFILIIEGSIFCGFFNKGI